MGWSKLDRYLLLGRLKNCGNGRRDCATVEVKKASRSVRADAWSVNQPFRAPREHHLLTRAARYVDSLLNRDRPGAV